jgi:hypothetical protein
MSDTDKEIPVKEQDDGSALIAMDQTADPFAEDKDEGNEDEGYAQGGAVEDEPSEDDDEDRERIREARREERRLKKELSREREASSKHKISALERRNEELARRLAAVENTATSYQFAQVDKALEDEATRVEYNKMKLLQASQSGNAEAQVEYLEQLQESKTRLAQIQAYKKQQLEEARRPKQNVPNEVSADIQRNATGWLGKNKWYDPQARDTDSKIAKLVDTDLAAEGWDPADPEYWDELDNRLQQRLPHRYNGKSGARRGGPTASSRSANPSGRSANTITLSKERVSAIKDAGAWDDPIKRGKMIRAYAAFDKQNRT